MVYQRVLILVFGVFVATNYGLAEEEKLKFSFYITSKCSDTINFITTKFYPVYQELGSRMDIEFIPWGKSKRHLTGTITCQFGATDCAANRLQSCALFMLRNNQIKTAEYMNCEFSTLSAVSMNYTCFKQVGLSEKSAMECFNSSFSMELQSMAEKKTKEITMVFVPTIVYNNEYDADVQSAAYNNFREYVCSLLQVTDPDACK